MSRREADAERTGNNQQLWRGMLMQGVESIRLDLEQIHRPRRSALGEHDASTTQGQTPGLMNAATTHGVNRLQSFAGEKTVGSHQGLSQAGVHPQKAMAVASMPR